MKLALLCLLGTFLTACVIGARATNDYVVMLTDRNLGIEDRCTGILIDNYHILTVNHCASLINRAVNIDGQDSSVSVVKRWKGQDLALLKARDPLLARSFPVFGEPDMAQSGVLIGMCPQYIGLTERYVVYRATIDIIANPGNIPLLVDQWASTEQVCGGDSGGAVIQNGKVVGIVNASDLSYFTGIGESAYATTGKTARDLLCVYNPAFNLCKLD